MTIMKTNGNHYPVNGAEKPPVILEKAETPFSNLERDFYWVWFWTAGTAFAVGVGAGWWLADHLFR